MTMSAEVETASAPTRDGSGRWPVLAVIGFLLGVLGYVLWGLVGLPAPLVGLLAVVICWLALRRQVRVLRQSCRGSWLARWGLRLGMLKLALFVGYLLFASYNSMSQVAA
jgi:hypothetical protein